MAAETYIVVSNDINIQRLILVALIDFEGRLVASTNRRTSAVAQESASRVVTVHVPDIAAGRGGSQFASAWIVALASTNHDSCPLCLLVRQKALEKAEGCDACSQNTDNIDCGRHVGGR